MTPRLLRSAILTFGILGLASGAPASTGEGSGKATPEISVPESHFDFEAVVPGSRVQHDFEIRNRGSASLEIERAGALCSCIELEVLDDRIPAGETGTIRATLDTTTLDVEQTFPIIVFTNDPDQGRTELHLSFRPDFKLGAHPANARWMMVQGEEPGTIPVVVGSIAPMEFEVVEVESGYPEIRTQVRLAEEDERVEAFEGSQWVVDLTLTGKAPVGPIDDHVLVHTDHPEQKVLAIPLSGFVRPELFVHPPEGDLGTIRGSEPRTWTFTLRNFGTDPAEVQETESTLPGTTIDVREVPEHPGHRWAVRFTLDPSALDTGPFEGTMTLKTNSPTTPGLTVPIRGELVETTSDENEDEGEPEGQG